MLVSIKISSIVAQTSKEKIKVDYIPYSMSIFKERNLYNFFLINYKWLH